MADLPLAGIDRFELEVEEDEDAIKTVWRFRKIVLKNSDRIEMETSHQKWRAISHQRRT